MHIDTHQHDFLFVPLDKPPGQLGGRGRFTRTLQTSQHDHHGRLGLEIERYGVAAENLYKFGVNDLYERLTRRQALAYLFAQRTILDTFDERFP
jgi:hypothetical protein